MISRVSPRVACVAIGAAGACGVFLLPWFVPVRGAPVLSDSYMLGFANTAATLALWAASLLLVLLASRRPAAAAGGPLWQAGSPGGRRRLRIVAVTIGALSLLVFAALVWMTAGVAYGEVTFFINRMAQLAAGYRPFTDFSYGYALGGLYGPVWLWRVLRGHGVSALESYYAVYAVFLLCSWAMLYALVARLALSDRRRALLFVCFGGVCIVNITAGIQYTLVRYLTPAVVLLAIHLTVTRTSRRWRPWATGLAALGGLLATLVFSTPEMELAALVAILAYFVVLGRTERRVALLSALTLAVGLAPLLMFSRGYFGLVVSFAGGAYNLPVLPGPPALVYVLAVFIVAALLPATLRGSPAAEQPLTVALVVLAALLVPAAFGRADSGHVFFNGILVFLLAAAFLARHRERLFAPFVVAVLLVFGVAGYVGITQMGGPVLLPAVATSGSLTDGQFRLLSAVLSWPPGSVLSGGQARYLLPRAKASLAQLDGYRLIAAPVGFEEGDSGIAFALAGQRRLALDPVAGLGYTQRDLATKLSQLAKADCLLLPLEDVPQIEQANAPNTVAAGWLVGSEERSYGALSLFPFPLYERNPQPNLNGLFAVYVHEHYRRTGSWGNYAVYVPLRGGV
ncbi:MAG: hypothetical protein ABR941_06630 [Thermoleophilia bacterium]